MWCQRCKEELNDGNKDERCKGRSGEAGHLIREHWDQKQSLCYSYKGVKVVCEDSDNHQEVILILTFLNIDRLLFLGMALQREVSRRGQKLHQT